MVTKKGGKGSNLRSSSYIALGLVQSTRYVEGAMIGSTEEKSQILFWFLELHTHKMIERGNSINGLDIDQCHMPSHAKRPPSLELVSILIVLFLCDTWLEIKGFIQLQNYFTFM